MRLTRERSPLPRLLVFPLIALGAFVFFWLRWRPDFVRAAAHCPLKDLTGIPCPTCGATSAAIALAAGDPRAAWSANPLLLVLVAGFLLWAGMSVAATLIPGLRFSLQPAPREKRAAGFLAALVLLAAWIGQIVNRP